MATVIYGGNRLIPAPFVNISKEFQKSGNGEIIGQIYNITITGTIIAWMGSPNSLGTFWTSSGYPPNEVIVDVSRFAAIQHKQESIRKLFKTEGLNLEIQSLDGSSPIKCYPRLVSISFPEGVWYEKCEYTIVLEADELYGSIDADQTGTFPQYISDASEEWSIDTNDGSAEEFGIPRSYSLSHTISAQGKRFYNSLGQLEKQPWENAKTFVLSKLGYDGAMILSSGVLNIPSYYQGLNHSRSENIDKQGGNYSVTETWVLASGMATEDFTVQTTDNLDSPYKQVTIEGTVTGYDQRDSNLNIVTSKWTNAEAKYVTVSGLALTRAQYFSGLTLNISPTTQTIGKNPIQGTITYTTEYNTRPSTIIPGAKSETINVSDSLGGKAFAAVFVLGRSKGPVLQALSTKQVSTRRLSIEAVFPATTYPVGYVVNHRSAIQGVIDAVNPTNVFVATPLVEGTNCFQGPEQSNYSITEFRYTFDVEWTFDYEGIN